MSWNIFYTDKKVLTKSACPVPYSLFLKNYILNMSKMASIIIFKRYNVITNCTSSLTFPFFFLGGWGVAPW